MVEARSDTRQSNRGLTVSAWLPVIAYMAVIYVLSALPTLPELPGPVLSWDKAQHVIAYLGLGLVACRAVRLRPLVSRPGTYAQSFGITALYGVVDEIHQVFVPGRSAEFGDWAADIVGAVLAVAVVSAAMRLRANGGRLFGRAAGGKGLRDH